MSEVAKVLSIQPNHTSVNTVWEKICVALRKLFTWSDTMQPYFLKGWNGDTVVFKSQEDMNKQILLQTVPNFFFFDEKKMSKKLLHTTSLENMLRLFQQELTHSMHRYYHESWLQGHVQNIVKECKQERCNDVDDRITRFFFDYSRGRDHLWWHTVFPAMRDKDDYGFNCMFGSSMLHLMLEDAWYDNVHSITMPWPHNLVARELDDGSLKLYDFYEYELSQQPFITTYPSSTWEKLSSEHEWVVYKVHVGSNRPDRNTFDDNKHQDAFYFYSLPSETPADLSLYLKDIAEVADLALSEWDEGYIPELSPYAHEILHKYPLLKHLNFDVIRTSWWLYDPYPLLDHLTALDQPKTQN